jgi:hypothetical protein
MLRKARPSILLALAAIGCPAPTDPSLQPSTTEDPPSSTSASSEPGNPDDSYLVDELLGVDLCLGTRMPKANPYSAAQIDLVTAWICQGAPP